MKNANRWLVFSVLLSIVLATTGCQKSTPEKVEVPQTALTISAASSLKDVMGDIQKLYKAEAPQTTLTFNFGASGTLQTQIEQGAPADLFMSAGKKQVSGLKDKGLLIDTSISDLLTNEMVLIAPKDSKINVDFQGTVSDAVKKIGVGEPKSVPSGQYAEEIYKNLKLLDTVKPKFVYANDVREILSWVETANVDVGIVYATDAKISEKVKVIATADQSTHSPIVYPAAVIKGSKNSKAALAFLEFLKGDKAKAVFIRYGFKTVK